MHYLILTPLSDGSPRADFTHADSTDADFTHADFTHADSAAPQSMTFIRCLQCNTSVLVAYSTVFLQLTQ